MRILALVMIVPMVWSEFLTGPQDMVYENGKDRIGYVSCIIPASSGAIFWSVKREDDTLDKIIYASTAEWFIGGETRQKFGINQDAADTGNYTLVIYNLQRGDTGIYKCQHGPDEQEADITVADPPGIPVISLPNPLVENQTETFTCSSSGGYPAPTIQWMIGSMAVLSPPAAFFNGVTTSVIDVKLNHTHHGRTLKCSASNVLQSTDVSETLTVDYVPRVSIQPADLIVLKGAQFELRSNISAYPQWETLSWYRNDNQLATRGEIHTESNGLTEDGHYRIRVTNAKGTNEASATVVIHYAPEIRIVQGDSIAVNEKASLELSCDVKANPVASIEWFQGARRLGSTANLTVSPVSRGDSGVYRCVATNQLTPRGNPRTEIKEKNITVTVQYAPGKPTAAIQSENQDGVFHKGDRVNLICSLDSSELGSPTAEFQWFKATNQNSVGSGRELTIVPGKVMDTDRYRCRARNSVGHKDSEPILVKFYDAPSLESVAREATNVSVDTNNYQIQCAYKGYPTPTIQWYKDDQLLKTGDLYTIDTFAVDDNTRPFVLVTSKLNFRGSQRERLMVADFGQYRCLSENSAGESATNYERQLNVVFAPEFDGFGKTAADLGERANLYCEVKSYPPVTSILFKKNGETLGGGNIIYQVDGQVHRQRSVLVFDSVSSNDFGAYTCIAENSEGERQGEIRLVKTSQPDGPTELSAKEVKWDSVHLSWKAGYDGGETQYFMISMSRSGPSGLSPVSTAKPVTETDLALSGLQPGTKYTFTVTAKNSIGTSVASNMIQITTPSITFPSANLTFDTDEKALVVSLNSTEHCLVIQGSNDDKSYTDLSDCVIINRTRLFELDSHHYYRVKLCMPNRDDVCSIASKSAQQSSPPNNVANLDVIIGVVIGVICVLIIVVIIAIYCRWKKRKQLPLKKPPSANGHINPIMTTNGGIPSHIQFSASNHNTMNSDLELDDPEDALPYGHDHRESHKQPQATNLNLDYIYASVQKKSAEQNKMAPHSYRNSYEMENRFNSLNKQPLSSSDNSDELDEVPPSPYRPNDLSFITDERGNLPYNRFPSHSGSDYSSPDSKQLKKVVYEVIV